MKKRFVSVLLILTLCFGVTAPVAEAWFITSDHSDVSPVYEDLSDEHWAYSEVMDLTDAGIIKGTSEGRFSPDKKVSVAQFLSLVGRIVFPDMKVEGADWFGLYVTATQEAGLLTGTQVDMNNMEAEISRYDMAAILYHTARYLDFRPETASEDQISDYSDIPTQYREAVLAVYGMGLICGDELGSFNGSGTMTRAETAVVVQRLWRSNYDLVNFFPDAVSAIPEGFISMEQAKASFAGKYTFMFWESQLSVMTTGEERSCVAQWSVKDTNRIVRYNWTYYINEELMLQSIREGEA